VQLLGRVRWPGCCALKTAEVDESHAGQRIDKNVDRAVQYRNRAKR